MLWTRNTLKTAKVKLKVYNNEVILLSPHSVFDRLE